MTTTCRNRRCDEDVPFHGGVKDVFTLFGFCPSCRAAITLGFNVGGGLTIALGIVGMLIGLAMR